MLILLTKSTYLGENLNPRQILKKRLIFKTKRLHYFPHANNNLVFLTAVSVFTSRQQALPYRKQK